MIPERDLYDGKPELKVLGVLRKVAGEPVEGQEGIG
jgi:hypothetical protein